MTIVCHIFIFRVLTGILPTATPHLCKGPYDGRTRFHSDTSVLTLLYCDLFGFRRRYVIIELCRDEQNLFSFVKFWSLKNCYLTGTLRNQTDQAFAKYSYRTWKRYEEGYDTNQIYLLLLTHPDQVTQICVSNLTTIRSDNGLSPGQRQTIIWTNT